MLLKIRCLRRRTWLGICGFHVQVVYDLISIAGTGDGELLGGALILRSPKPILIAFLAHSSTFSPL